MEYAYLSNFVPLCSICGYAMKDIEKPKEGKVLVSCYKYLCSESGVPYSLELPKLPLTFIPKNKP